MDGSEGARPVSKTVADIWEEVQLEQRRFNWIIVLIAGLLFVAAVIATAFFVVVTTEQGKRLEQAKEDLQALAAVSAGDAKREAQRMRTQVIEVREALEAQRRQAELTRQVDQALAASRAGTRAYSLGELKLQALDAAEQHLAGHGLNEATSYLVSSIAATPSAGLTTQQKLLLDAALANWRNPGASAGKVRALAESSGDPELVGFGHLGLAQIAYAETTSMDEAGGSQACQRVYAEVDEAAALGVQSMAPYLWKGECLRDAGNAREAFKAFAEALKVGNVSGESLTNLRLAAHGAGTTLIARAARSPDGSLPEDETVEALTALEPIEDNWPNLRGALSSGDPIAAAYALLEYAADLRVKRGEGDVGKIYTAENIGFVFILRQKWLEGYSHAEAIDKVLPMGWNLTVLHICASELARQPGLSASQREKYQNEADRAARVLSMMEYGRIGVTELKKLLPSKYAETVDRLAEPARKAKEVADAQAVSFSLEK